MQSNLDKAKEVALVCLDCIVLSIAVLLAIYLCSKVASIGWYEGKASIEKSK